MSKLLVDEISDADNTGPVTVTDGAVVNRTGDGTIIDLQSSGTTVGSIVAGSSELIIGTADTGLRFYDFGDAIIPRNTSNGTRDATTDLGASGNRFKDLYLSGGVYLGGTGAANKLDDYETGTWNPEIYYQNAGDQADATNNTQNGYYVKVGSVVTVAGYLNWTLVGSAANDNIGVKNFPFAAYNGDSTIYNTCAIFLQGASSYPTGGYIGILGNNGDMMNITDQTFAGNAGDDIGAGTRSVAFVVTYRVL
jgi:hypothetical protein